MGKNTCHSGLDSKCGAAAVIDPDGTEVKESLEWPGMALCLANRGSESISDPLSTSPPSAFNVRVIVAQLPARRHHRFAIRNM